MEMEMLIRRLKQRLRDGGRRAPFRCIATSATITSSQGDEDRQAVAEFATELFGEPFSAPNIVFGESLQPDDDGLPRRFHAFLRALEGTFLVHREGTDAVGLNRKSKGKGKDGVAGVPLEIALCRECGQHYYVGREHGGRHWRPTATRAIPDSASTTTCRQTMETDCCADTAAPSQCLRPIATAARRYP